MTSNMELYNTLAVYGDQVGFAPVLDVAVALEKLKAYEKQWALYTYRSDTVNNRWGLSLLNHDGKLGPGPDLDQSVGMYNQEHGTTYNEIDFTVPTPAYRIFQDFLDPYAEWLFRCHVIQLRQGGYFPPHTDYKGDHGREIDSFRLLIPLANVNPTNMYFIVDGKALYWEPGRLYYLNTCKTHTVFTPGRETATFVLLNVKLTHDSVKHFLSTAYLR